MNYFDIAKKGIKELVLTLSNKKSLLSSKRLERFAAFSSMLLATDAYLVYHIFKCSLTSTDLMIVVAGWLTYVGFNVIQGKKEKQNEQQEGTTI